MKALSISILVLFSFTCGYVFGCNDHVTLIDQHLQDRPQQENVSVPYTQSNDEKIISYEKELKEERAVTIVFTLDEKNRIHVLHVSGGVNLVTQYIKNSLEGKEIHSDNAIPGINYVMTVKLPTTV